MIDAPGETRRFEGRYRTPEGEWRWIECINVNRLNDPDNPVVETTMRKITIEKVSLTEQLRARQQLLSRLSDAMPIGMFQIDSDRTITFTNDRLHVILGCPACATVVAQFACVEEEDRHLLDTALEVVLGDVAVDDVELRFVRGSPHSSDGSTSDARRVCVLSMRPLTDDVGRVTGAVGCIADVTEQVSLRQELELRANVDELTSCLSRSAILQLFSTALEKEQKAGGGIAILFVDLCRFKEVNDLYGHAAGDLVLQVAGTRLKNMVREGDHVGRFGGDEFLVVCPGVTSEKIALEVAERIRRSLSDRLDLETGSVQLSASVGVALSSGSSDPDALIAQADYAMYEAKRLGSLAVEVFASR
jgi:diguanylate cyclase (GGDEF)-like protein